MPACHPPVRCRVRDLIGAAPVIAQVVQPLPLEHRNLIVHGVAAGVSVITSQNSPANASANATNSTGMSATSTAVFRRNSLVVTGTPAACPALPAAAVVRTAAGGTPAGEPAEAAAATPD